MLSLKNKSDFCQNDKVSKGRFSAIDLSDNAATGGLIPYKNPPALIGYYVAIASLIPGIGNIAGLIALILGIIGLKKRRANPAIGGVVHAWIGIILGGGLFLAWNGCVIAGFLVPLLNR